MCSSAETLMIQPPHPKRRHISVEGTDSPAVQRAFAEADASRIHFEDARAKLDAAEKDVQLADHAAQEAGREAELEAAAAKEAAERAKQAANRAAAATRKHDEARRAAVAAHDGSWPSSRLHEARRDKP